MAIVWNKYAWKIYEENIRGKYMHLCHGIVLYGKYMRIYGFIWIYHDLP
jgi:hypothetical protein